MRSPTVTTYSEIDVLINLAGSLPPGEEFVQVGASVAYPAAWQKAKARDMDGRKVGMLHLGPGRHRELHEWMPQLVKGAIVVMEGYRPAGEAYDFAIDLAARGYLTSLSEARYFKGLGVSTYLGES